MMEHLKKYYCSIRLLSHSSQLQEKLSALEEIKRQFSLEFSGEKWPLKKPESSIFSNQCNVDNLFLILLDCLVNYSETNEKFLDVLCLACKHLMKKVKVELHVKICNTCSNLAEKAVSGKNWIILEKCLRCLTFFESRDWNNVLFYEQQRNVIMKIIQLTISFSNVSDERKNEFIILKVLCFKIFNNLLKTEIFKTEEILNPKEWFTLLFPLLFDENYELRRNTYMAFSILKKRYLDISYKLLSSAVLREQLKMSYSKTLIQYVRANESDWVDLWCLLIDLLSNEFSSKNSTVLLNYLLEVEETAFRSGNMSTRYSAFVGWKFLVSKFLDHSLENASRRLKLLMQPLKVVNSKTVEIGQIKFDVWWQLIIGIEPCMEHHATTILNQFLNFCFGAVNETSSVNTNGDNQTSSILASRQPVSLSAMNCPRMSVQKMKGLDVNRTDALAQILNLNVDSNRAEYKLTRFSGPVISHPRTFLSLSKVLIHCVGECTVLIEDSEEVSSLAKKMYLKDIWTSLLLHIKNVDGMTSTASNAQDNSERNEKIEMMKNLFRTLLRLHDMTVNNDHLAIILFSPILETVLSAENGLSDEILTSRNYYVGTDVLGGTPLLIILDMLLSPACLSVQMQIDLQYWVLLQRILHLGIGPPESTILFTQAVMKRLDSAIHSKCVETNKVKHIWIMVTKLFIDFVDKGYDVNQGSENNADFSCLMTVLMFPVNNLKYFMSDDIVEIWGELFVAFQKNVFSNVNSMVGSLVCNTLCGKINQEIGRKKDVQSNELLFLTFFVACVIEHTPFSSLNKILIEKCNEREKLYLFQQCFQTIQTLSSEIQKLRVDDKLYVEILTKFAKCLQLYCDNLKGCPINFLSMFFIEQIQFLLSITVEKITSANKEFAKVCCETWNSFINVLLSDSLKQIGKEQSTNQKILKIVNPVIINSLEHHDHNLHEITFKSIVSRDVLEGTKLECNKCKIIQEGQNQEDTSSLLPNIKLSGDNIYEKSKVPLNSRLTKHQREMFNKRRDDIPALYADLTQDSQPLLSDTSQDLSSISNIKNCKKNTEDATTSDDTILFPPETSFNLKENLSKLPEKCPNLSTKLNSSSEASQKCLLSDSVDDDGKETNLPAISKQVKVYKRKCTDKKVNGDQTELSFSPISSPSETRKAQDSNNQEIGEPAKPKTLLVLKLTSNNLLNLTPNESFTSKDENVTSESRNLQSTLQKANEEKSKDSIFDISTATKEKPIRMCFSKLKTGTPEIKNIVIHSPASVSEEKNNYSNKQLDTVKSPKSIKKTDNSNMVSCENLDTVLQQATSVIENCLKPADLKCVDGGNAECVVTPKKCDEFIDKEKNSNISSEKRDNSVDAIDKKIDVGGIDKKLEASKENKVHSKEGIKSNDKSLLAIDKKIDVGGFGKNLEASKEDQVHSKEGIKSNDKSPQKEFQSDATVTSSDSNVVVSPARVVLKRLEVKDVKSSVCKNLSFKDNEVNKSNEEIKVNDHNTKCEQISEKNVDHQNIDSTCILEEHSYVGYKGSKSGKCHGPIQTNSHKEGRKSFSSNLQGSDYEFSETYCTRSKAVPTLQKYEIQSESSRTSRFTPQSPKMYSLSVHKQKLAEQKKSSPKDTVENSDSLVQNNKKSIANQKLLRSNNSFGNNETVDNTVLLTNEPTDKKPNFEFVSNMEAKPKEGDVVILSTEHEPLKTFVNVKVNIPIQETSTVDHSTKDSVKEKSLLDAKMKDLMTDEENKNDAASCKHSDLRSNIIDTQIISSKNEECVSLISCDKGEYVRQLSLMPQTSVVAICHKTRRISTRSDWARRFSDKCDTEFSENIPETISKSNSGDKMIRSVDSFDCEDIVESSQNPKEQMTKQVVFKEVWVKLPKWSPDCILNDTEGELLITEISPSSFRVTKKCDDVKECEQNEDNSSKDNMLEDENKSFEVCVEVLKPDTDQTEINNENKDIENENSSAVGIVSDDCRDTKNTPSIDHSLITEKEETGNITTESRNDILICNKLNNVSKRKRKRKNDSKETDKKRRRLLKLPIHEQQELQGESYDPIVSGEGSNVEPSCNNGAEVCEEPPTKSETMASLLTDFNHPMVQKRSKCVSNSSPCKRLSGRAAHLVGLALTKEPENCEVQLVNTAAQVHMEEVDHEVVFCEGQEEKRRWFRPNPQPEASPGRSILKRKLADSPEKNDLTPSKKSVRFSDPDVTATLHFKKYAKSDESTSESSLADQKKNTSESSLVDQKKNTSESSLVDQKKNTSESTTTIRIVRCKKGKLYLQRNFSSKPRRRNNDREARPIWPSLKDCKLPVSEIIEQLTDRVDDLRTALSIKNISTVGELCSLVKNDIREMPIREPKISVFKLLMQVHEQNVKNDCHSQIFGHHSQNVSVSDKATSTCEDAVPELSKEDNPSLAIENSSAVPLSEVDVESRERSVFEHILSKRIPSKILCQTDLVNLLWDSCNLEENKLHEAIDIFSKVMKMSKGTCDKCKEDPQ